MNELNEFWPRLIMGCGALITGILLLSVIAQHKEKFSNKPLINIEEKPNTKKN
tara:strand:+ start:4776 stop:4934 length:159 start_codon:yes stop_codon:yes gene_type:complete